jgi:hypothetical protein
MLPEAGAHCSIVGCEADAYKVVIIVGFIRVVDVVNIKYLHAVWGGGLDT